VYLVDELAVHVLEEREEDRVAALRGHALERLVRGATAELRQELAPIRRRVWAALRPVDH
jgi:hypothetical protein